MNVLIINLTRFGDLLQMQPLILELKAAGHKVGLVCLGNFAEATMLLRGVDFVAPLHGAELLRSLDSSWHKALSQTEALFSYIQQNFAVDQVINTTATISSRILARRIAQNAQDAKGGENTVPLLGFGLDDHGFGQSGNMWATFLQGASAERLNCPFNMVDMFRALGSLEPLPHKAPLRGLQKVHATLQQEAKNLLQKELPHEHAPQCKGFVALQLGASEKRRQWDLKHFASVSATLWQELALCPVLLGSPAEKELGETYLAHTSGAQHPVINVIGKTNIPHLAAVLQECSLLITNDTGTMHLAAGLDVPVLSIFLATAQAFDTGPYVPHACCLEPALDCHPCAFHSPCVHKQQANDLQPCLTSIEPHTVSHLALHFLRHGLWQNPKLPSPQARIWITQEDATGFASLQCISGHEQEERSRWLAIQRYFYRHILDDNTQYHNPPLEAIAALSPELRHEVHQALQQCSGLLHLLSEQLLMLQRMPAPHLGQRILSTCNTIHNTLGSCNQLKALSYLWLVLFQERGGALESFTLLVHSLRAHLLAWQQALNLEVPSH